MRNINARLYLKLVSLCCFIALAMINEGNAGEYFIYQDSKGTLVLSNKVPPTGSKIIKRETLPEVSDQELAESRLREERMGLDNRVAGLEQTIAELSDNLRAQSEVLGSLQQLPGDHNIAVGVTQAPTIVTKLPRGHVPPHVRHDSTNAQPRRAIPTAPQHRPGGRAG